MNEKIIKAEQDVGSNPTISTMKVGDLARYYELSDNPKNGKIALIINKVGTSRNYYKIWIDGEFDWVEEKYLYEIYNYEN